MGQGCNSSVILLFLEKFLLQVSRLFLLSHAFRVNVDAVCRDRHTNQASEVGSFGNHLK